MAEWLTRWHGSPTAWGSISGCATKIVRCKNLAIKIKDCVSLVVCIPRKAIGPMYIRRVLLKHVKEPRAPVDKSMVVITSVTGQIPEFLRIAVKARIVEASARSGCLLVCASISCTDGCPVCPCISHLIICTAHLSIEVWKMRYLNASK